MEIRSGEVSPGGRGSGFRLVYSVTLLCHWFINSGIKFHVPVVELGTECRSKDLVLSTTVARKFCHQPIEGKVKFTSGFIIQAHLGL